MSTFSPAPPTAMARKSRRLLVKLCPGQVSSVVRMLRSFACAFVLCWLACAATCHDDFGSPSYPSSVPAFDQLTAPVGPPVFIHGGVIVNADSQYTADVLMENGIIVAIGSNIDAPPNAIKIDAGGK